MLATRLKELQEIGFSAGAKILSIASQYLIIAMLARSLTGYEFGVWALLFHLMAILPLCDFGIGGGGLRNELTKLRTQKKNNALQRDLFFSSFFLIIFLSLILLGVQTLFLNQSVSLLFHGDRPSSMPIKEIFLFFASIVLIKTPFTLYGSGFYSYQEITLKALLDVIESIALIVIIAVIVWMKGSFIHFFLSYYLFTFSMSVVGFVWFLTRRRWEWSILSYRSILGAIKPLLKVHLLFWLQNIVSIVLFSLSPLLISMIGGVLLAGEYSLIYRVYSLFIGIHFAMLNPLWSYYAAMFHKNPHDAELKKKCIRSAQMTALVLSIAALGVTMFYQPLIYLWTGKNLECLSLVILSGVWVVLYGVTNCFSILLNAMNKIGRQVLFLSIGACLNLFLGILLGRVLNMLGVVLAAIIALIPLLCSNILEIMCVRKGVYETS